MDIINYAVLLPEYFSREAEIRSWCKVEAALADVQGELGMIPKEAADTISSAALNFNFSIEKLAEIEKKIRHPLVPFLRELEPACEDARQYLHFGATTQNIQHTGLILRTRDALSEIEKKQAGLINSLCNLAIDHKETLMPGRTHTQHALPITFGFKVAGWLDEFSRHIERQNEMKTRFFTAMMGGGVGSNASFGEFGKDIQDAIAKRLDLKSMPIPHRLIYDSYAEYISVLSISAGTIGRIAADLKSLMRTEVGEVFQDDGSVGSSTMPQKRNPRQLEHILFAYQALNSLLGESHRIMVSEDDANSLLFHAEYRSRGFQNTESKQGKNAVKS